MGMLRPHQLRLLAGTWNVNETRCSPASLAAWLAARAGNAEIVALGLQVRSAGRLGGWVRGLQGRWLWGERAGWVRGLRGEGCGVRGLAG